MCLFHPMTVSVTGIQLQPATQPIREFELNGNVKEHKPTLLSVVKH